MSDKTRYAYLAGIIDGEGCFCIGAGRRQKWGVVNYNSHLTVGNTDIRLVQWLKENFGGSYYTVNKPTPRNKTPYVWRLTKKKEQELLTLAILPYLIIKRERAIIFLEFVRLPATENPEKRTELWNKLRILNKRGVGVETNMQDASSPEAMIESELQGDLQSDPVVTQEPITA